MTRSPDPKKRASRTAVDARQAVLEREATRAAEKLNRFYKLIAEGAAELDDLLNEPIPVLKNEHDRPREAFVRDRNNVKGDPALTYDAPAKFVVIMRQRNRDGVTPGRKRGSI